MKTLIFTLGITLFRYSWTSKQVKKLDLSNSFSEQKHDTIISFDQQTIGERLLFTGGSETVSGSTKTNGIYITKITNNQIEYAFTQLINWKKEFERDGKAVLTSVSDSMDIVEGLKKPAYKFTDSQNEIVIFITKDNGGNETRAKVFGKSQRQESALMYQK